MASDVSTIVSIARGEGTATGVELDVYQWASFAQAVRDVVEGYCGPLVADGLGKWWYYHTELGGQTEDNYIVVAGDFPLLRDEFEQKLAALAKEYRQDSIAVTYAVPSFVTPA